MVERNPALAKEVGLKITFNERQAKPRNNEYEKKGGNTNDN